MKKLILVFILFSSFALSAQSPDWQFYGTKYPNASNKGDTVSVQTRIPILDAQGLLNYYLPVGDLIGLNPLVTWESITGDQGSVNLGAFNNDVGYLTTEVDPTVPSHVKSITSGNISTWNSALQSGDNNSTLVNDSGFLASTIPDLDARYVTNSGDEAISGKKEFLENIRVGGTGITLINGTNRGILTDSNAQRTLIGGGSTWSGNSGAYMSIEGNDFGGTGLGGNIAVALPPGKKFNISRDLEVMGKTLSQGGLFLPSIPVGLSTYDHLVVNPSTGEVSRIQLGTFDFAVADGATTQFNVNSTTPKLNFVGSGDTSVSFNGTTNTVTITSIPGAGGGGAVTSFEGRDGAVVSQAGDYNTGEVNELGNLYFTEYRVRSTTLTGFTPGANTSITTTDNILQAFGKVQGQLNTKIDAGYRGFDSRYVENSGNEQISGIKQFLDRSEVGGTGISFTDAGYKGILSNNNSTRVAVGGGATWSQTSGAYATFEGIDFGGPGLGGNIQINLPPGKSVTINRDLGVVGNITGANLSGNNTGDQTLSGLGGVPTSRTVTAGAGLLGGGDLSVNRTLAVDYPTLDARYVTNSGDEAISGKKEFLENIRVGGTGITLINGTNRGILTDSNAQRTLIGGGSTWSGNSGAYISIEGNDFGGTGLGGNIKFNLTSGAMLSTNSSFTASGFIAALGGNSTQWNTAYSWGNHALQDYAKMNLTSNSGYFRTTGNIISDSNIQASGAIITGAGSFTGRVSGADAVNDNEFVTRRQVAPIAASGSGLARLAGANTAMVTNSSVSGYYTEGGATFGIDIPAGTFSDNVHFGALTIDLNAALTYTGTTTTGTEAYSMDVVFIQGATIDRIPFYVTSIPRDSKLGYLTFKMTAISRSSAGIFMISGGGNQYPSGAPFMDPYTLNIDARQAFTIRIRKGSTGSDTNMDVDVASFVVTTMDGGAQ